MQPHSLKLSPESDLINSIKEYSLSNNLYGYVSGVVGNLRTVCIQCPGNQEINKFEEILKITGSQNHIKVVGGIKKLTQVIDLFDNGISCVGTSNFCEIFQEVKI